MSQDQRKRVLLGALLVVVLVVVWRQLAPQIKGGSGAREVGTRGQAASAGTFRSAVDSPEVVELRLEDLEKVASQYRPGRDPFRFGEAQAVQTRPPEEPSADAEREVEALAALRRAMEARESRESAGPRRPVLPDLEVKFLGSFGTRQRRLAVFSDGAEIINVLEGGVLKDHFVVRHIGFESVDVGFVDYPDEPAIRLAVGG